MRVARLIVPFFPLVALFGCMPSTSVVSEWQAPGAVKQPLTKVLVCLPGVQDVATRQSIEDRLVDSFPPGVTAAPCYTLFPDPSVLRADNKPAIVAKLQQAGFDGALSVVLQSVRKRDVYVPPQVYATPGVGYGFYNYRWHDHYRGVDPGLNVTPGYVYEESKYLIETVLFGIPDGNILWTITTESVNPDSRKQIEKELDTIIHGELKDAGFLR
jgi:hypothetical protein